MMHSKTTRFMAPSLTRSRKAQIEVPFNWIYVLVAGGVILLFFVGIAVQQKKSSEERLGIEVVRVMESIFTGAGVSEKTKHTIDASGLAEYTLYFDCREKVGVYGISGTSARAENSIDPLFSPAELQTTKLIVWSLPYKLPYKIIDFLFVSSANTLYVLTGNDAEFINEFINQSEGFTVKYVANVMSTTVDPGKSDQVRVIEVDGTAVQAGSIVPPGLQGMADESVTAVSFVAKNMVKYYQKKGMVWEQLHAAPVPIVSLGGEQDAATYAAIFSGTPEAYWCNMQKAWKRAEHVNEVYTGKLEEIISLYAGTPESLSSVCFAYVQDSPNSLNKAMKSHSSAIEACMEAPLTTCINLIATAHNLQQANSNLREKGNCIALY